MQRVIMTLGLSLFAQTTSADARDYDNHHSHEKRSAVFTVSNEAEGNRVFAFSAARDGSLGEPQAYSTALVFSTKYDPDSTLERLTGEALDERYFGLHHDLQPELIARQLGGDLVWKRDDDGMWIALIHFNHPVEARLEPRTSGWRSR